MEGREGGGGGWSCDRYDPVQGSRRCRHYSPDGSCALPSGFMCPAWLARMEAAGQAGSPARREDARRRNMVFPFLNSPAIAEVPSRRVGRYDLRMSRHGAGAGSGGAGGKKRG